MNRLYIFFIKFEKCIAFPKPLCYYWMDLQNLSKKNIEKLNKKEGIKYGNEGIYT